MFRQYLFKRFYLQKVLYSEGPTIRRFCAQKVLYSEGPMFRRSYVQKKIIQKVLYSEGSMFKGLIFRYIQKVLYSENSLILAHSVKGQMSFCHGALSVVCPSTICQNLYRDFNQHSEQPQTRSDHRRIVPAIQEYDT